MSRAEHLFLGSHPHQLCKTDFHELAPPQIGIILQCLNLRRFNTAWSRRPTGLVVDIENQSFWPDAVSVRPLRTPSCNLRIPPSIGNDQLEPWPKVQKAEQICGWLAILRRNWKVGETLEPVVLITNNRSHSQHPSHSAGYWITKNSKDICFADQVDLNTSKGPPRFTTDWTSVSLHVCFIALAWVQWGYRKGYTSLPVVISKAVSHSTSHDWSWPFLLPSWCGVTVVTIPFLPSSPCPYHLKISHLSLFLFLDLLYSCSIRQLW